MVPIGKEVLPLLNSLITRRFRKAGIAKVS
jgi:hypothetical protein